MVTNRTCDDDIISNTSTTVSYCMFTIYNADACCRDDQTAQRSTWYDLGITRNHCNTKWLKNCIYRVKDLI